MKLELTFANVHVPGHAVLREMLIYQLPAVELLNLFQLSVTLA